jgi:hypothetical protein
MLNKVQFTARDLNTMYAAGILHTRESLGFGNNFKKAGVKNEDYGVASNNTNGAEDSSKTKDLVSKTTIDDLIKQLELANKTSSTSGNSKNPNQDANTNPDGNTGTTAGESGAFTRQPKAYGGVAETATDNSKGTSALAKGIGPLATLLGVNPLYGVIATAAVQAFDKWNTKEQQKVNDAEAQRQRDDMARIFGVDGTGTTSLPNGGTDGTEGTVGNSSTDAASNTGRSGF